MLSDEFDKMIKKLEKFREDINTWYLDHDDDPFNDVFPYVDKLDRITPLIAYITKSKSSALTNDQKLQLDTYSGLL